MVVRFNLKLTMQDNNQKEPQVGIDTPVVNNVAETVAEKAVPTEVKTEGSADKVPALLSNPKVKTYGLAVLAVLVIVGLLVFGLEKQGRISTGIFSAFTSSSDRTPVATVNGIKIIKSDYESSLQQLLQMAASQGASTTDPALLEQYQKQAMDTLVNGELLRQSALEAGLTASADDIEKRYGEIRDGVGGAELLAERMNEFKITEKSLRRDIENEILIQALFATVFTSDKAEVTEEEINALYDGLGGEKAGLPPLTEVKDQVIQQIKLDRQQQEAGKYIEELRTKANIEILI